MINTLLAKIGMGIVATAMVVAGWLGVDNSNNFVPTPGLVGSVVPVTPALFETSLSAPISTADLSMTLAKGTLLDGSTLTGYTCFTVDSGQPNLEYICGTASGTAITSLVRGVNPLNGTTSVTALIYSHRRGANVKVTDFPALSIQGRILSGLDGFPNEVYYDTNYSFATSSNKTVVTKGYVDGIAIAGSPIMTTAISGIAKVSTAAASSTNPIVVGDNDTRVPTQGENDALVGSTGTPSSSNKYITQDDAPGTGNVIRNSILVSSISSTISGYFGSGADGEGTVSTTTTLVRDMYYNNLTVQTGAVLNTAGFRVFVKGTTTLEGTGTIERTKGSTPTVASNGATAEYSGGGGGGGAGGTSGGIVLLVSKTIVLEASSKIQALGGTGGAGGNGGAGNSAGSGSSGAGGAGGSATSALASGSIAGGIAGVAGATGGAGQTTANGSAGGTGTTGTALTNGVGSNGATGTTGGNGGDSAGATTANGGAAGTGGAVTNPTRMPYVLDVAITMHTILDTAVAFIKSSAAASGGAGGGGGGGNSSTASTPHGGGGGGGGGTGGTGGVIVLIYETLTNAGTISVAGGAGGAGGTGGAGAFGGGTGSNGNTGSTGTTGVIYQFDL